MKLSYRAAVLSLLCLNLLGMLGCSKGPPRYDVSGTVTYNGQPVPAGAIILNADAQSGNTGPQGRAEIVDGEISIKDGMGTVGGQQWIQIMGSDGNSYQDYEGVLQQGKTLFEMIQKKIELPRDDVSLNIRISPPAAKGKEPTVEIDIE